MEASKDGRVYNSDRKWTATQDREMAKYWYGTTIYVAYILSKKLNRIIGDENIAERCHT